MTPRRRDFQRVPEVALPAEVRQVGRPRPRSQRQLEPLRLGRLPGASGEHRQLRQAFEGEHLYAVGQGGLGPIARGHNHRHGTALPRRLRDPQNAGDRPDRPIQRQLPDHRHLSQPIPCELAGGGEKRRRNGQIKARTSLTQAGRGKVGDYAPQWKLEAAIDKRGTHALARLPHRGVGQADHGERREPAMDIDLHPYRAGFDAVQAEGADRREHDGDARSPSVARGTPSVRDLSLLSRPTRTPPA